jgi:hypothetical protein
MGAISWGDIFGDDLVVDRVCRIFRRLQARRSTAVMVAMTLIALNIGGMLACEGF